MPRRRRIDSDSGRLLTESDSGTARVLLITPGWGTSGYYPAEVIAEHGPAAFPAGTHMYLDHPTAQEAAGRPERSIRDLAAVTTSDAVWDPHGVEGAGLYAEARVFAAWRSVLAEAAGDIGVSIRALGRSRMGEAEGRKGRIVESIDRGLSADFVTRAGRGGRILELIEAARNDLDEAWSHNETREMLTQHLHSTRGDDEDRYLWVRDLGDDWVVWEDYGPDSPDPGYYRAGYSVSDGGTVTLGDAVKVTARTVYTPTDPAALDEARHDRLQEARNVAEWFQSRIHLGFTQHADDMFGQGRLTKPERIALSNGIGAALDAFDATVSDLAPVLYQRDLYEDPEPPSTSIESDPTEGTPDMPLTDQDITRIGEAFTAALAPLTEALAGQPPTTEGDGGETMSESERTAREQLLTLQATRHGEALFAEGGQLADFRRTLPAVTITRLVETAALQAPHGDDLGLDADKLTASLDEAAKQAAREIAAATGSGRVTNGATPADTSDAASKLTEALTGLGLDADAAKIAAAGR